MPIRRNEIICVEKFEYVGFIICTMLILHQWAAGHPGVFRGTSRNPVRSWLEGKRKVLVWLTLGNEGGHTCLCSLVGQWYTVQTIERPFFI